MDETRAPQDAGNRASFDSAAAVTRSMLGWGVVAGPLYLVVGLVLALTREGFDLAEHQLSLLMLGDGGWMQRVNLALSGVLVLVAAIGARRAAGTRRIRTVALLIGVMAVGLVGSAVFPPDPMAGFPPGAAEVMTASGMLHLVLGLVAFGAAGAAALTCPARWSKVVGAVVLVAFLGGAVLSQSVVGVVLLWVAVVSSYAWLAAFSVVQYRTVPHPDGAR